MIKPKRDKATCLYKGELLSNVSGFRYACEHHENPFIDCSGEENCQYKKCINDYLPSSYNRDKEENEKMMKKDESAIMKGLEIRKTNLFDRPTLFIPSEDFEETLKIIKEYIMERNRE